MLYENWFSNGKADKAAKDSYKAVSRGVANSITNVRLSKPVARPSRDPSGGFSPRE